MKAWDVEKIRGAVKGKWVVRGTRAFNGKVATDSRKVAEGELFIAIEGEKHDAHRFAGDVVARGAAAVIVHKEPAGDVLAAAQKNGVSVLLVENTVAALNRLAGAYRGELRARVIAVGGSNGKTSTKRIIHTLLCEKYGPAGGHASPKSFNNNIGMPLTILDVESSHEFVVLEIGTNAPGEIAALGEVCRPDIAVITSVGLEHLEKLGNLEGVAREEASIVPYLKAGGMLVVPADAPELLAAIKGASVQQVMVSVEQAKSPGGSRTQRGDAPAAVELLGTDVKESLAGVSFSINGRGRYETPLLGAHNVLNALLAMAVARKLGATDEQIIAGLKKVEAAPMRLQVMEIAGVTGPHRVINDAYNANPTSMEAAIVTFSRVQAGAGAAKGRSVAILGDMLELGHASDAMHRAVGTFVVAGGIDLFVAVGPQMRLAADVAAAGGVTVVCFAGTAAARAGIGEVIRPGDAILLKGSRGMAMETILESLAGKPALATAPGH